MSYLTGALYARVLKAVETARQTGETTSVVLVQQKICVRPGRPGRGPVVCPPGMYHVGLLARSDQGATRTRVLEHGPVKYDASRFELDQITDPTIFVPLPSVHNTLDDIAAFEASLPTKYIIGIRDCRHHVLDLLNYLYD